jgi:hypothetical protein
MPKIADTRAAALRRAAHDQWYYLIGWLAVTAGTGWLFGWWALVPGVLALRCLALCMNNLYRADRLTND